MANTETDDKTRNCRVLATSPETDSELDEQLNGHRKRRKTGDTDSSFTTEEEPATPIPDSQLTAMTVRELNASLVLYDREVVRQMRERRRALKNRGYATNCRVRRIQRQASLEGENAALRAENEMLRGQIRGFFFRGCDPLLQAVTKEEHHEKVLDNWSECAFAPPVASEFNNSPKEQHYSSDLISVGSCETPPPSSAANPSMANIIAYLLSQ